MSLALYRKYRPGSFKDLIGQDFVATALQNALKSNNIFHAYLFSGPRGCGKTSSARILAKCLNCEKGPTADPCGVCDSCKDLSYGGSLDVIEIDAASHGGIDDARDIRQKAILAPVRDRYKVFIIDEAHMVTPAGFNALLKIIEEPPEHIKFIFATTDPDKVIPTIRSRTQHFRFGLITYSDIEKHLKHILQLEKIDYEPGVLNQVISAGSGSLRDSLSILDQLIIASLGEKAEKGYKCRISLEISSGILGFSPSKAILDFITAIIKGSQSDIFDTANKLFGLSSDISRTLKEVIEYLSNLLAYQSFASRDDIKKSAYYNALSGLSDYILDIYDTLKNENPAQIIKYADILSYALNNLNSPSTDIDILCAKLYLGRLKTPINTAGGAPEELSNAYAGSLDSSWEGYAQNASLGAARNNISVSNIGSPSEAPQKNTESYACGDIDLAQISSDWQNILKSIPNKSAYIVLAGTRLKDFNKSSNLLTIEFASRFNFDKFKQDTELVSLLKEKLKERYNIDFQFNGFISPKTQEKGKKTALSDSPAFTDADMPSDFKDADKNLRDILEANPFDNGGIQ